MKKTALACLLGGFLVSATTFADSDNAANYQQEYLNQSKPTNFSEKDKRLLNRVQTWDLDRGKSRQTSYVNGKGTVIFTYGAENPEIVCAVMQLTDIELEPGEQINSVNIGDPSRWNVEPAQTGSGGAVTQHVLLKPLDSGLETSMLIATDQRGYRIKLKSSTTKYYPHVQFAYPEKMQAAFNEQQRKTAIHRERNSITTDVDTGAKTYMGDLNFEFDIDGDVSWKPVRVYDDGKKTIIEMPEEMQSRSAPALMLLVDKGGIFSDEVTEIINYRLQGNRYVVDGIFDTAILTLDLDSRQQRVVITRKKK